MPNCYPVGDWDSWSWSSWYLKLTNIRRHHSPFAWRTAPCASQLPKSISAASCYLAHPIGKCSLTRLSSNEFLLASTNSVSADLGRCLILSTKVRLLAHRCSFRSICFLHTPSHFYSTSTALFRSPDSFSFSPLDPLPLVGRLLYKALYAYLCSLGTRLVIFFFSSRSAVLYAPVHGILPPFTLPAAADFYFLLPTYDLLITC